MTGKRSSYLVAISVAIFSRGSIESRGMSLGSYRYTPTHQTDSLEQMSEQRPSTSSGQLPLRTLNESYSSTNSPGSRGSAVEVPYLSARQFNTQSSHRHSHSLRSEDSSISMGLTAFLQRLPANTVRMAAATVPEFCRLLCLTVSIVFPRRVLRAARWMQALKRKPHLTLSSLIVVVHRTPGSCRGLLLRTWSLQALTWRHVLSAHRHLLQEHPVH
jgi:hypothetical protein